MEVRSCRPTKATVLPHVYGLCRRTAEILVRQQDLVQVCRDRDIVVLKVSQPGALAGDGVGQQRQHLSQADCDRVLAGVASVTRGRRLLDGAAINAKLSRHGCFLTCRWGDQIDTLRSILPRKRTSSVRVRIAIDRHCGPCGFDPIEGKHQLFLMQRFAGAMMSQSGVRMSKWGG